MGINCVPGTEFDIQDRKLSKQISAFTLLTVLGRGPQEQKKNMVSPVRRRGGES